ncbi:porin family protein [Psychroserpens ponticola]|uniref:Outer membrane beta-barrel protein n=1 Tax=Psychroserpens ponticola TaxID=2932268 RepID=A0ABY7S0W0_9FLAO|nr:outer membrane beta-barrel protein [Psychroserpens ponticola]WCO03029.1 outer membrane beta-barrel protein [Psychroserpens ponticola]
MRNIMLFIAVAVFSLSNVSAQERDKGVIEIIPYLGYSSFFLNGDEVEQLDSRASLSFGVKGDYYFNDRWSLRSGLTYDAMGASVPKSDLKLDYLNIPVNVNWHFGSTRKWNLNFGVTPGFLMKADIDGDDVKDFYKSFQLGISYGIGYKLEISESFSLLFDSQGFFGVTNILEESDNFTRLNAGSNLNIGGVFTF